MEQRGDSAAIRRGIRFSRLTANWLVLATRFLTGPLLPSFSCSPPAVWSLCSPHVIFRLSFVSPQSIRVVSILGIDSLGDTDPLLDPPFRAFPIILFRV